MRRQIDIWECASEILSSLKKGVLLTTSANGKVNTMTISWGTLGIEWDKPIFTTFLREGRFTRELLDVSGEFTVNVPLDGAPKKLIAQCGTTSGRDKNKAETFGLTYEPSQKISAPALREFALTLECRVIYKRLQDKNAIGEADRAKFYPQDVPSENCGANKDYHVAYVGEIVAAYVLE